MKNYKKQVENLCKNWALDEIFSDVPNDWRYDYDLAVSWLQNDAIPEDVYVWEPLESMSCGELHELLASRLFGNLQFATSVAKLTRKALNKGNTTNKKRS